MPCAHSAREVATADPEARVLTTRGGGGGGGGGGLGVHRDLVFSTFALLDNESPSLPHDGVRGPGDCRAADVCRYMYGTGRL